MKHVRIALPSLVAVLGVTGLASRAEAQRNKTPKPPPVVRACGAPSALPLSVGNEWVYVPGAPPPDRSLTDAQKRLTPVQPERLVIKVTAIDTKDGVTTVSLTEELDGKAHPTWIKCAATGTGLSMAPDAFWFAGEAGTTFGIELTQVERKGNTFELRNGRFCSPAIEGCSALDWHDDMTAGWKHLPVAKARPKMKSGKLELNRHWVVQPDEELDLKGVKVKTSKLGLETTVKTTVEPPPPEPIKPAPLLVNFIWVADGIGPVQVLNSYGQLFLLDSHNVAK